MKASEAKTIAQSKKANDHFKQYEKIMSEIKHYATGGFFWITVYEEILPTVLDKLVEDGYKISQTPDGRNGIDSKISWKDD